MRRRSEDDDEEQVKKNKHDEYLEQKRLESFRFIMGDPQGRLFINWLLSRCGIMRISYSPKSTDTTAFNEGMRNVGLQIFSVIDEHFPKEWLLMREEAKINDEETKNG